MDPKKDELIENHTKFKVLETTKILKTGIKKNNYLDKSNNRIDAWLLKRNYRIRKQWNCISMLLKRFLKIST